MMVASAELIRELKMLRKGRGLFASRIGERIGAALRDVCDVVEDDGPAVIRQKVTKTLESLACDLPTDLRVAVLAAFAIWPDARMPLYQDRVSWAANLLDRDPRTARRRIDDGIDHLAQLASTGSIAGWQSCADSTEPQIGWHSTDLRVMLALDRPRPLMLEQRRVVSDQDNLTALDLAATLATPAELRELEAHVFHGGTLVDRGMESSSRHTFGLLLPRPLSRGEEHEFAVLFQLPETPVKLPHFVCVPKRSCATFDLRVRFDRLHPPQRIWRLNSVFQRDVYDPVRNGDPQLVDQSGELHQTFRDLAPGMAHGARWEW